MNNLFRKAMVKEGNFKRRNNSILVNKWRLYLSLRMRIRNENFNLNNFSRAVKLSFWSEEDRRKDLSYLAIGLGGETGEVLEIIKRCVKKRFDYKTDTWKIQNLENKDFLENVKLELGDVMWYLVLIIQELGIRLEDVLKANVEKITDRNVKAIKERIRISGNY